MQKQRGKAWYHLSREWRQCLPRYTYIDRGGGGGHWSKGCISQTRSSFLTKSSITMKHCFVSISCGMLASSPARAKNGEAHGTHYLHMCLISPRCGDSGLFSDSSVLCDVRVRTWYSILVRILQWRVMKVQIAAQLLTLLNIKRFIIAVSKLSTLRLHSAHMKFAEPSS